MGMLIHHGAGSQPAAPRLVARRDKRYRAAAL